MSGSRSSKLKLQEIAALIGMAVFIPLILFMAGKLAWPTIQENWFPLPTPVTDVRPLAMTNEEINGCIEPTARTIMPGPSNPGVLVPAVQSLVKSGVISEPEPLLRRIINDEAIPYWMWSAEEGLLFAIGDIPGKTTYVFTIYCTTQVGENHYPLYDTVTVSTREEILD